MSPATQDHCPVQLGGLLGGVLLTQIVDSAVHLAQPMLIADLSGSLGSAAMRPRLFLLLKPHRRLWRWPG